MRLFEIPQVMQSIAEDLAQGNSPDPSKVALIFQDGPKAVEDWIDAIDTVQGEFDVLATRIQELEGRLAARKNTVDRMKKLLSEVVESSFQGKLKTPLVTVWNQDSVTYDFTVPASEKKYWVTPESRVDKRSLLADLKAGVLPSAVTFTETKSNSIRIKR